MMKNKNFINIIDLLFLLLITTSYVYGITTNSIFKQVLVFVGSLIIILIIILTLIFFRKKIDKIYGWVYTLGLIFLILSFSPGDISYSYLFICYTFFAFGAYLSIIKKIFSYFNKSKKKEKTVSSIILTSIIVLFGMPIFIYICYFKQPTIYTALMGLFAAIIGGSVTFIGIVFTIYFQKESTEKEWKSNKYSSIKFTHDYEINIDEDGGHLIELSKESNCNYYLVTSPIDSKEKILDESLDNEVILQKFLNLKLYFIPTNYPINTIDISEITINKFANSGFQRINLSLEDIKTTVVSEILGKENYHVLEIIFYGTELVKKIIQFINQDKFIIYIKIIATSMVLIDSNIETEINFEKKRINDLLSTKGKIENISYKYLSGKGDEYNG